MANLQSFGLTGRRSRPDFVGSINARTPFLGTKKRLEDEEEFRNRTLALQAKRIASEEGLARDRLEAGKKASTTASAIGLGEVGLSSFLGRRRDEKLAEIISGGGGRAEGAATPSGDFEFGGGGGFGDFDGITESSGGFIPSLTKGAKNFGSIFASSITGGTAGAVLGERIGGENTLSRVAGGAITSGALGYLASGDPYTAGLSALFGGIIGGFT